MTQTARVSRRVSGIPPSAIHEMTRLSRDVEDVAFLSWAKPTADTPEHIKEAAVAAIRDGLVGGYSETAGLPALREAIAGKLKRDNHIEARSAEVSAPSKGSARSSSR
jgi:aminotransferase